MDPRISETVESAFSFYRETRDLKKAMQLVVDAALEDKIPLGLFDDAKAALGELLKELAKEEDGQIQNEWERISKYSLTELIGIEHTERNVEPVKSGALEVPAGKTSN
ncbi:MAG TPA: hypothetical protein PKA63_03925 [Oligoflexia bacterium]|nr:hypothetical protein [Oligoflexia bacterium]HMP47800.1 hypothetical protein [Oligoflexia bacterium]